MQRGERSEMMSHRRAKVMLFTDDTEKTELLHIRAVAYLGGLAPGPLLGIRKKLGVFTNKLSIFGECS